MKLAKTTLLILFSLIGFTVFSQKTAVFKGKLYKVYPHTIDSYNSNVYFQSNSLKFNNLNLPPIIGSLDDGDYLIYNTNFVLKNKRKINKEIVYDTVYQVFATFPIKNNKKEGNATIYFMYTQDIRCVIPYKNDLIDGHFVLYQKTSSRSKYDWDDDFEDYDDHSSSFLNYIPYKQRVKFQGSKIELNYEKGLLNGLLKISQYRKKDTVLVESMQLEQGFKNGPYKHINYWISKGKIQAHDISEGHFVKSEFEGKWISTNYINNNKEIKYYSKGVLGADEAYSDNRLLSKHLWGRDSVVKYYPNFKTVATFPDVAVGRYSNSRRSSAMVYYLYYNGVLQDYTYRIDGYIKPNFYHVIKYVGYSDTVIAGRFYRTRSEGIYRKVVSQYLLDSCNLTATLNSSESIYCPFLLVQTSYDRKGNVTDLIKTAKYYELNPNEKTTSLVSQAIESHKALITKKYYPPLDYDYQNVQWIKGRGLNSSLMYKVIGDKQNGSIVKVIKIPMKYDTLVLNDTLMKKGKFLYQSDEHFRAGFESYLLEDESNKWNDLNAYILNFFKILPKQHKSIYLGKEIYTGEIEIDIDYKRNPKKLQAKLFEIVEFFGLQKRLEIVIKLEQSHKILRKNKSKLIPPTSEINYSVMDGVFNGSVRLVDVFDHWSVSSSYYDNNLNDDLEMRMFALSKRWNKKMKYKDLSFTTPSLMTYAHGLKEGQWYLEPVSYGNAKSQYVFHNNQLNGTQYRYAESHSSQYISYVYPMHNDTVNGEFWRLRKNGYPIYHGHFIQGIPHGTMVKYFNTNDKYLDTSKYYREKFVFDHGYLSGRYEYFRDTDNLKFTIDFDKKDSMFFTAFTKVPKLSDIKNKANKYNNNSYSSDDYDYHGSSGRSESLSTSKVFNGYNFIDQIFESPYFKRGLYTYYYKSGLVFKQGYKTGYEPSGKWTFFRDGQNRIYKTIDFHDSALYVQGSDTVFSRGLVKAYYDDGKTMFVGFATDNNTKYTCESEADIPTEENYYLAFYDSIGNNVLATGSGFVTELQASGHKLKEGQIAGNRKQGIWIYYNNFGQAESIGMYENGLKVGRWLSGDLSGLNLSDKLCFMNNDEYFNWISMYGGNLDLTETFYSNGELINSNSVETIKR